MANLACPFDSASLAKVQGERASTLLLDMLISPQSMLYNMVSASVRPNPNGTIMECPQCGWVAIFTQ